MPLMNPNSSGLLSSSASSDTSSTSSQPQQQSTPKRRHNNDSSNDDESMSQSFTEDSINISHVSSIMDEVVNRDGLKSIKKLWRKQLSLMYGNQNDGDSRLDRNGISEVMRSIGYPVSDAELDIILANTDGQSDGKVTEADFIKTVTCMAVGHRDVIHDDSFIIDVPSKSVDLLSHELDVSVEQDTVPRSALTDIQRSHERLEEMYESSHEKLRERDEEVKLLKKRTSVLDPSSQRYIVDLSDDVEDLRARLAEYDKKRLANEHAVRELRGKVTDVEKIATSNNEAISSSKDLSFNQFMPQFRAGSRWYGDGHRVRDTSNDEPDARDAIAIEGVGAASTGQQDVQGMGNAENESLIVAMNGAISKLGAMYFEIAANVESMEERVIARLSHKMSSSSLDAPCRSLADEMAAASVGDQHDNSISLGSKKMSALPGGNAATSSSSANQKSISVLYFIVVLLSVIIAFISIHAHAVLFAAPWNRMALGNRISGIEKPF